jgi:hypothetical protein
MLTLHTTPVIYLLLALHDPDRTPGPPRFVSSSASTTRQANERQLQQCLSWRCEGLSLLHNIGDENSGLGVAGLTPRMRRFGRYLEGIACLDSAGRLTLYGKLETAFQDIGGFDSRMRVSPDGRSSLYCRFHKQRYIARHRTVCLRQDLPRDTARRCGRRTLGRRFGSNKLRDSADRARRKTRETSPCQHDVLPACARFISSRTFLTVSLSRLGWQGVRRRWLLFWPILA